MPDKSKAPAQSSAAGAQLKPLQIVRGTVLTPLGSNTYVVGTDSGVIQCTYGGSSRGGAGPKESGGFISGAQVWLALDVEFPGTNATIIGGAATPKPGHADSYRPLLVYPQLSGVGWTPAEDPEEEPTATTSGAKLYRDLPGITNYTNAVDALDGEWSQQSLSGAGVGVDAFRSWLRGGPASGVEVFALEDRTRVYGSHLEIVSLAESYESLAQGCGLTHFTQSWFYLSDRVFKQPAQRLVIEGPQYNGRHEFVSYRREDNLDEINPAVKDSKGDEVAPAAPPLRHALFYEHRSNDGTYTLSTAGGITLKKSLSVPMPGHYPVADDTESPDELYADPAFSGAVRNSGSSHQISVTLAHDAANLRSHAWHPVLATVAAATWSEDLTQLSQAAFKTLNKQWNLPVNWKAKRVVGDPAVTFSDSHFPVGGWSTIPSVCYLNVDPYADRTKKFYYGTALISITPDGGIVLDDVHGSSIRLSGGNIYIQPKHDLVLQPGRDVVMMAGQNVSMQAGQHIDIAATAGRFTAVASGQASLTGGLDGRAGVLIESMGEFGDVTGTSLATIDTMGKPDDNGMYRQGGSTIGGVVLKSKHSVAVATATFGVSAKNTSANGHGAGHVFFDVDDQFAVRTEQGGNLMTFGASLLLRTNGVDNILGSTSVLTNLHLRNSLFVYREACQVERFDPFKEYNVRLDDPLTGYVKQVGDRVAEYAEAWARNSAAVWAVPARQAVAGGFLSSYDYALPKTGTQFQTLQPTWVAAQSADPTRKEPPAKDAPPLITSLTGLSFLSLVNGMKTEQQHPYPGTVAMQRKDSVIKPAKLDNEASDGMSDGYITGLEPQPQYDDHVAGIKKGI